MASAANMSSPPTPKVKQKHVTTACTSCRTRKIKCNAAIPSCSNCVLYSQECIYQHGLDKRKVPLKERLVATEAYAQELEVLLNANGIALPKQWRTSSTPPPNIALPSPEVPRFLPLEQVNTTANLEPQSAHQSWPIEMQSLPAEGSSPLVDQITGSLGALQLAEDGQLRFYGATSNLHLLIKGARKSGNRHSSVFAEDIQIILRAAGVDHVVQPELEEHLIKLYFCWEDPSIHLVQEDVFYRERQKCRAGASTSKLYSEVLVNSMCAVGASLTSRHCVDLPEPLVDFFASRARALLEVELDSPTLSTVQSLAILSGVESIRMLDARGWLYSGMAIRLATDLGLHLDSRNYLDAGIIDYEEALLRRVVFWGAFIHERMWSLYLGRPVSLDENAITTPRYVASTTQEKYWQPYVDDHEDFSFPSLPDPIEELHRNNASLCAKMTRVRDTLYSDAAISGSGAQRLHDFASDMRSELIEWLMSLPESLRVDMSSVSVLYVPHVIQLHMQYHTLMILVNRPFFAATTATMPNVAFTDPNIGRPACTDSARAISKLLQIYRRLYGLRRINIQAVHLIFTASLVHVLNACETAESSLRNAAWRDLEACQQALSEMGKGFQSATRALDVINGIKNELLSAARKSAKRSAPVTSIPNGVDINAKRRRPSHAASHELEVVQDETILSPSVNFVDSLFWSELTSFDFPRF